MLQQVEPETGRPRRPGFKRTGQAGLNLPARHRRTGRSRCRSPHQQDRKVAFLRRQSEPATGRQVKGTVIAPEFQQHSPKGRAPRGLHPGLQQASHIPHPHQQEARRINAEFRQAGGMHQAGLGIEKILPYQQNRPLAGRPPGKGQHQAAGGHGIGRCRGMKFMQGRPGQPALQRRIQRRQTEGNPGRMTRLAAGGPRGRHQAPGKVETMKGVIRRWFGNRDRHGNVPVLF